MRDAFECSVTFGEQKFTAPDGSVQTVAASVPNHTQGWRFDLILRHAGGDATVTVVHSRSQRLAEITRSADILIAAIGQPEFVQAEHVRDGAVVIDVGINRVDDATAERGYRLVGDVAFDEVSAKVSAITPVPGGVGPMTIAMLMANTVKACRQT